MSFGVKDECVMEQIESDTENVVVLGGKQTCAQLTDHVGSMLESIHQVVVVLCVFQCYSYALLSPSIAS